jgi:hypothetical protein
MDPKSPQFKLIQKYWYKKLKDQDFVDIEDEDHNLKTFNMPRGGMNTKANEERCNRERTRYLANARFYTMCRQFLHTEEFLEATKKRPKHRIIWEMYSEGIFYRIIAKKVGMHVEGVRYVLRKLIPIMMEEAKKDDESNSD